MIHTARPNGSRRPFALGSGRVGALAAGLVLLVAACAGEASSGAGRSVSIVAPASGAQVGTSFPVTLEPSFAIGRPDTGRQHIHLHYDGRAEYDIVYETTHTVTNLGPGMHRIVAVVANADHSETDVRSPEVTVDVEGAGSGPATVTTAAGASGGGPGGY